MRSKIAKINQGYVPGVRPGGLKFEGKSDLHTEHSRPAPLLTLSAQHVHDSIYMVQGYRYREHVSGYIGYIGYRYRLQGTHC